MSDVGQIERKAQQKVIKLFTEQLGYRYLGNWEYRDGNSNIEAELLDTANIFPVYQKNNAILQKSYLTGIEEHVSIGNLFKHAIKTAK